MTSKLLLKNVKANANSAADSTNVELSYPNTQHVAEGGMNPWSNSLIAVDGDTSGIKLTSSAFDNLARSSVHMSSLEWPGDRTIESFIIEHLILFGCNRVNIKLSYSIPDIFIGAIGSNKIFFYIPTESNEKSVTGKLTLINNPTYFIFSNIGFNIKIDITNQEYNLITELNYFDSKIIEGIVESLYYSLDSRVSSRSFAAQSEEEISFHVNHILPSAYRKLSTVSLELLKDFVKSNHDRTNKDGTMVSDESIERAVDTLKSKLYEKFFHNVGITRFICEDGTRKSDNISKLGNLAAVGDTIPSIIDFLTPDDIIFELQVEPSSNLTFHLPNITSEATSSNVTITGDTSTE